MKKKHLYEDAKLMLQVAKNDLDAFGLLYNKYLPILSRYLINFNANATSLEDITQEVFLRIWQKRAEYRPESTFKAYLFGFARKVSSERLKQVINESRSKCTWSVKHSNGSLLATSISCDFVSVELLKQITSKLPVQQREAIKLFYYKNMSYEEATSIANCSVEAFEGRLRRARKNLMSLLNQKKQNKNG